VFFREWYAACRLVACYEKHGFTRDVLRGVTRVIFVLFSWQVREEWEQLRQHDVLFLLCMKGTEFHVPPSQLVGDGRIGSDASPATATPATAGLYLRYLILFVSTSLLSYSCTCVSFSFRSSSCFVCVVGGTTAARGRGGQGRGRGRGRGKGQVAQGPRGSANEWVQATAATLGLESLRGGEILEVLDETQAVVGEKDETGNAHQAQGNLRTYRIAMDAAQYQMDQEAMLASEAGVDVYTTFNLLMRRQSKENNFKAVLETIRDLMNTDFSVPSWLHDVLLGCVFILFFLIFFY
jgi:hypothetical protein